MTEMICIKRGDEWKAEDSVSYEIQEVRIGGARGEMPRACHWPQGLKD